MADKKETEIILKGKFENGEAIVSATKKIDKNLKDIGNSSEKAEKQSSSLASTLKKLGAIVGITALANGFKNLVKGSLQAAGSMEQVNIALTTMLGSGEKAAKLQKELVDFAKKTPFEIEGIFDSTKQLLAYGFAQEEIIPTMSTLGNIAAGVGVDMGRLALVFGQVKTAGKLMGQDLLQFTGAGVPLVDALSETLGKSKAEVVALKESGQISFEQVKVALESLTKEGGRFFNLMENQSKTFLGTVSNMSDSFYQVKVALGEALLPVAKRVVDSMVIFFGNLKTKIDENKETITAFATALVNAFSLIGKAIGVVISLISNFAAGLMVILKLPFVKETLAAAAAVLVWSKGISVLTIAVRILTATMFGWVSVIATIITVIGYLSKGVENLPAPFQIAILTITKYWEQFKLAIIDGVDQILSKLSSLANIPGFGWINDLKDNFSATKDSIISNINDINAAIDNLKNAPKAQDVETTQNITQNTSAPQSQDIDPEKAAKARLKAAQDEYASLLEAQKQYLGQYDLNQKDANALEIENNLLKQQQKLLQEGDYAERKKELDGMLLNDEITMDQYRTEMQAMNAEARMELLQNQYDAELEKFIENQTLMDETKNQMQLTQDETELAMLQTKLDGIAQKQQTQNDKLIQLKIKKDELEQKQTQKQGDFQLKFEKFMSSEQMKNAQKAASELVALQNSKNKQLAAIGKAAAIFQITTDTARGAMSAYSSLAPIPIVGPALGAAAAAAVIAYGAERISQVTSASYAVGTPNIPNDHMAMVHAGEMIIPATFAEAIRSGDLSLSGGGMTDNSQSNSSQSIVISFDGASFYGQMNDEEIKYIGERLGQLITENIITPIPTRRA